MICHKCGAQVDDQAAFCDKCGALLQNTRPSAVPTSAAYQGVATGAPAYTTTVQYAGFWKRFAAALIDGLIFAAIETVIMFILMGTGVVDIGAATADASSSEYQHYMLVSYVVGGIIFVVQIAYFAIMESSSRQATLGKMVLGIVVTDGDGKRISFGRALGRNLSKILSQIILLIGYFMIAFTEKKQGLHDIIAGTVVVVKR